MKDMITKKLMEPIMAGAVVSASWAAILTDTPGRVEVGKRSGL
jgi:hypothetical protein